MMDFSSFTQKSTQDILKDLKTSLSGLSPSETNTRLKQYGTNTIKSQGVGTFAIFLRQFKSPFLYLLAGAGVISFFFSETIDTVMIFLFIAINVILGFYQENKSAQALNALKQFIVAKTRVIRDGHEITINTTALVPGDIILLFPGDILPADVRFLETEDILINESVLTGESVSVKKTHKPLTTPSPQITDAINLGFSGTTVIEGEAKAVVIATGKNTQFGQIARLTLEADRVSAFEKEIGKFSMFILRLVGITLAFVLAANFFIKGGEVNFVELLVFSIALAVSVIPEALPVVTLFSLSRGALRLAHHKVVVKRLAAIEDLGSVEILCSDKTGTLTQNKLSVDKIYTFKKARVLFYAAAASQSKNRTYHDEFTAAILSHVKKNEKQDLNTFSIVDELPFDPERKRSSFVLSSGKTFELVVKGATESLTKLSNNLTEKEIHEIHAWEQEQGKKGQRVIAFAIKKIHFKKDLSLLKEEKDLTFLGMISFVDPLKETASASIKKARDLGVHIKIITGDSAEVAGAVAHKIGLIKSHEDVMLGSTLEKIPSEKLLEELDRYSVFARISPQQKYMIIQTLQQKYKVGFLGEGINDAPALKIADVGIVVSEGSDVAREAADIVLLQKSLSVIIDGIEEGREVFANTIKYIRATLTSNFGNFYAVAIASLIINFLPMLPLQLLLLNLLSDFPMIVIATDTVDPDELKKPRSYDIKDIALIATILGLISTIFDFVFFALFSHISPQVLHTNWFIGSVLTELVFIFSIRTRLPFFKAKRPSTPFLAITLLAAVLSILIPFTEFGQKTFKFVHPSAFYLFEILIIVVLYFTTTEVVKLLYYRYAEKVSLAKTKTV